MNPYFRDIAERKMIDDLTRAIRRFPELVTIAKKDNTDFSDPSTTFWLEMDGRVFWEETFTISDLMLNDNSFIHERASKAIEEEINRRLEGLDWDEYFYPQTRG